MADPRLTELAQALVSIDSTNPSLVDGGAGEVAIAAFVAAWGRQRGFDVRVIDASPRRPSVVVTYTGTGGGRTLLLNAHMDTVGGSGLPVGHSLPFVSGGRLYGRGALDTKGGLAAFMMALDRLRGMDLPGTVILTAVADEECESIGTAALLTSVSADGAVVAEPTQLALTTMHKGFVWIEVEVFGFAAHGSLWEVGVDAIAKAGFVLTGIDQLANNLRTGPQHPVLGPASVHISVIAGGTGMSTYPARCVIGIERRTLPGETTDGVLDEVRAILNRARGRDATFHAEARATFQRPALEGRANTKVVELLADAARQVGGVAPGNNGFAGWTDASLLDQAGIPSVVFGPIGEGLHGAEEWVDLDSLEKVYATVLATAVKFCG
ncbi:MAG TPA: M20/M25/M40 family metallo-hydrolase [Candidatus Acidoferrales bacterium]|nr:M20/M25/M40 family metallo-hydrolase [Candidatus Acidoferrales bacterium]